MMMRKSYPYRLVFSHTLMIWLLLSSGGLKKTVLVKEHKRSFEGKAEDSPPVVYKTLSREPCPSASPGAPKRLVVVHIIIFSLLPAHSRKRAAPGASL